MANQQPSHMEGSETRDRTSRTDDDIVQSLKNKKFKVNIMQILLMVINMLNI